MERKAMPSFTKAITGRNAVGILTVFGNRDSYDDISHPGSFQKTIGDANARVAGQPRWRFLWNHNMDFFSGPPIAVIKSLREVTRNELPEEVLAFAPDATGGVEISRDYLDTPRGDEVFKAVQAGAVDEMSYGFDPIKFDFTEASDKRMIRNLREIRFWEGSDVIWGANPATLAAKGMFDPDQFMKQLLEYVEGLKAFRATQKAGARHSSADTKLLNAIHKAAVDLGATDCKGFAAEEETDDQDESGKKSRAVSQVAETLTLQKLNADLEALELSILHS